MNSKPASTPVQPPVSSRRDPLLLALIAFVLGIVLAGAWFHRHHAGSSTAELSDVTKDMLGRLEVPVTVRYYSLLPAGSADESLQAFAGRVTQLLDAMQKAGNGKVAVIHLENPAGTNSTAASTDGIQAFNLDKGEPCFLGLAITSGKSRETFARLQPDWEPALQYDLVRAISRVAAGNTTKPVPAAKPSPEIIDSVKKLIPDVNAVTAQQADQILHDEFMKQCSAIGAETATKIQAAQQRVVKAEAGGLQSDIEAARKNLLQVQLAQGDKLKALAAQLQSQLTVFQQMKAGAGKDGH